MNPQNTESQSITSSPEVSSDYSKLLSLLALATGAIAMPQTSEADIIFTDLSGAPPVVGPGASSLNYALDQLPGTARPLFQAGVSSTTGGSSSRFVLAGQGAGYVRFKAQNGVVIPNQAGAHWDEIGGVVATTASVGWWSIFGHAPSSYDHLYLAFEFRDSTAGNAMRFGWAEVSLNNPANGTGPDVTIFGYAYDNTGAQIAMGDRSVPEPASAAVLALALGAMGVRSWRRNRSAASQS